MDTTPHIPRREPNIGFVAGAPHLDGALARTLRGVLHQGHVVGGATPSREILNYTVIVEDPRDRILLNPVQNIRLVTAIARLAWTVGGNDRLADIAFYEPRARAYSDDGLIVPGSDYGRRLFKPRPGLNQIEGVIARLRGEESGSEGRPDGGLRRAAAVIWEADDAVRESDDVPCAFGMFFHVRSDELVTTLVMRSNNAVTLLPWNIFEFGIIAELVAASVGVELGPFVHQGVSMHVFESAVGRAEAILCGFEEIAGAPRRPMAPMPSQPEPLKQAEELARLEAALRHGLAELKDETDTQLLARAETLHPWWRDLYRVLLVHALVRVGRPHVALRVVAWLDEPLQRDMRLHMAKAFDAAGLTMPTPQLSLAGQADRIPSEAELAPLDRLDLYCERKEQEDDRPLTRVEYASLRNELVDAVAARGRASGADDFTYAQFEATLASIRHGGEG
jgi:hypothetical protein